ncbi:hypothetical protein [Pseudochryseolinea flava]|uniref:tRNA (Guanine-N1)-methyltransferase n=1 Tax=Pseudochryseolinea flava TaxID=2059302 RepID=A0A364Y613_9BACT|nr:hypothetical protein [Pseudochryseolinea flava]RAW01801.1 hypothetical protein DQQ10_09150 [Pseudochryseolinea flava]
MMKKIIAFAICILSYQLSVGQAATTTPPTTDPLQGSYTLRDRFQIMKTKSQTYQNYKVIKESVLDGVWRIVQDSLHGKQQTINQANQQIASLKAEVKKVEDTMKQKDASVQGVIHDSTHISVIGVDFSKGFFLTLTGIILAALVGALVFVLARMKVLDKSIKEKSLTISLVSNEYDEYKKKAMEKQTKLSRELQDERNRLQELRRS